MALELKQMRQVLMLAELGSFARAAVVLNLSQPALSRSMQALERQLGGALFLRSSAGVLPTDLGRVLVQRARELVQMADELEMALHSKGAQQSGQLCVGSGPYPIETVITPALTRFIAGHPLVSVRLLSADWDQLLQRLRARELDFFVAEISTLSHEADLLVEALPEHALYFVGRVGHPLLSGGQRSVSPEEALAFPFAAPARIPPRLLAPMLAAKAKLPDSLAAARPFPSIECNVVAAVKRIVAGSDTLSALTLSCLADELADRRLALVGAQPWMTLRYGLVSLKDRPLSTPAQRLRELIIAAEAELAAEEEHLRARWLRPA